MLNRKNKMTIMFFAIFAAVLAVICVFSVCIIMAYSRNENEKATKVPYLVLDTTSVNIYVGDDYTVKACVFFDGKEVSAKTRCESDNVDVFSVEGLTLTGVAAGSGTVGIVAEYDGRTMKREIAVTVRSDAYICVNEKDVRLYVENDMLLPREVEISAKAYQRDDLVDAPIRWSVIDESVVELIQTDDRIRVIAKRKGVTSLYAEAEIDGTTVSALVSVRSDIPIKPLDFSVDFNIGSSEETFSVPCPLDGDDQIVAAYIAGKSLSFDTEGDGLKFSLDEIRSLGMAGEREFVLETANSAFKGKAVLCTHVISDVESLVALNYDFYKQSPKLTEDDYIILANDIDCVGNGENNYKFMNKLYRGRFLRVALYGATFDGRGHRIMNAATDYSVISPYSANSVLKNVALVDIEVAGPLEGGIMGTVFGTIENVFASGTIYSNGTQYAKAGLASQNFGEMRNIISVIRMEVDNEYPAFFKSYSVDTVVSRTYAVCNTEYSYLKVRDNLFETVSEMLTVVIGAETQGGFFLTENGWSGYWGLSSDGKLLFGGNVVLE